MGVTRKVKIVKRVTVFVENEILSAKSWLGEKLKEFGVERLINVIYYIRWIVVFY